MPLSMTTLLLSWQHKQPVAQARVTSRQKQEIKKSVVDISVQQWLKNLCLIEDLCAWTLRGLWASLKLNTRDWSNVANMIFPSFTIHTYSVSYSLSTCCSTNSADWAHKVWENSPGQGREDFKSHYRRHICWFHSSQDSPSANTC